MKANLARWHFTHRSHRTCWHTREILLWTGFRFDTMDLVPATRKSGIEPDRSLSKTPTSVKKKVGTPYRAARPKVVDIAKIQAEARAKAAVAENQGRLTGVDAIRKPLLPSLEGTKAGGLYEEQETRGSEQGSTSLASSPANSVPLHPTAATESPTASGTDFKDLSVDSELHSSSMQGSGEAIGSAVQSPEDPRFSSFLRAVQQMQETVVAAAQAGGWSLRDSECREVRETLSASAESPEYAIMRTVLLLANRREAKRRTRRLLVLAGLCTLFLASAALVWCIPWAVGGLVERVPT